MKDYFTSKEQLEIMMALSLKELITGMYDNWSKRKCLTSEEKKYLKTSLTFLEKFLELLFARTSKEELEKLNKKMKKNTVRMYDNYELERLNKKINNSYATTHLTEDEFCLLAENLMDVRCKDCKRSRHDCDIYKFLEENNVPEFSDNTAENCKYSYTL